MNDEILTMSPCLLRSVPLGTALLLAAAAVPAQTISLDEGTYRILIDGTEAGMETFSIRQNGTGADMVVIARGRVVLDTGGGSQEIQASIQLAGTALRPAAYDVEVRGTEALRVNGRITGNRASARTTAAAGETMREFLVADGAVFVDEGVAHQYYFVVRRAGSGTATIPLISPRGGRQVDAVVSSAGNGTVKIGSVALPATRYLVAPAVGAPSQVWTDSLGRELRVAVPSRNYVAVRTAPPVG
ncbi:MAG: hypothetical protein FIB01_14145 [Gemmatimonadetes bacterium]|nr:hypothetical protein [Gemmatimonadota bacterium]